MERHELSGLAYLPEAFDAITRDQRTRATTELREAARALVGSRRDLLRDAGLTPADFGEDDKPLREASTAQRHDLAEDLGVSADELLSEAELAARDTDARELREVIERIADGGELTAQDGATVRRLSEKYAEQLAEMRSRPAAAASRLRGTPGSQAAPRGSLERDMGLSEREIREGAGLDAANAESRDGTGGSLDDLNADAPAASGGLDSLNDADGDLSRDNPAVRAHEALAAAREANGGKLTGDDIASLLDGKLDGGDFAELVNAIAGHEGVRSLIGG